MLTRFGKTTRAAVAAAAALLSAVTAAMALPESNGDNA
jgi:hypothetical protein